MPITDISILRTSMAKKTPPSGDLKIPAIPAAAPQPNNIRVADGENFISLATLSPIAAPENAQGPSAPAEAPKPIVTRHPINGEKR